VDAKRCIWIVDFQPIAVRTVPSPWIVTAVVWHANRTVLEFVAIIN